MSESCPDEMLHSSTYWLPLTMSELRTNTSHTNVGYKVNLLGPHTGRLWLGDLDRSQCSSCHNLIFGKPALRLQEDRKRATRWSIHPSADCLDSCPLVNQPMSQSSRLREMNKA